MHEALARLIDALAAEVARDYLTEITAPQRDPGAQAENHPDLEYLDRAA